MFDVDDLIARVFERPAIWNKRAKLYKNRTAVDRCWKEIAEEMQVEDHLLKKKWKYLRDQYATELAKEARSLSRDAESKWQYFKPLSFLNEIVKPRQSYSSNARLEEMPEAVYLKTTIFKEENEDELTTESYFDDFAEVAGDVAISPAASAEGEREDCQLARRLDGAKSASRRPYHSPSSQKTSATEDDDPETPLRKRRMGIEDSEQGNSSRTQVNKQVTEDQDEHMLFFKTLLPHVKKIRPEQIFPFRSKIQDVVQQFAYPDHFQPQ